MPKVNCSHCGTAFATDACRTRYCDTACYHGALRARSTETLVARFWAKVNKTPTCWLWTAGTIRGYGQFHLPRTGSTHHTVYAHRYAWTLTNGPILDNLSVLHRCDVPLCVNPEHLFLGTQPDNLADARAKGRLIDGLHAIKVSDAGVEDIQARYRPRVNGQELAAEYGVTLATIVRLANGTGRVRQQPLKTTSPQPQEADGYSDITSSAVQGGRNGIPVRIEQVQ